MSATASPISRSTCTLSCAQTPRRRLVAADRSARRSGAADALSQGDRGHAQSAGCPCRLTHFSPAPDSIAPILRADPAAIAELYGDDEARQLVWRDGAPAVDEQGKLRWKPVEGSPPLFLGFNHGSPRFSALPDGDPTTTAYAHFQLLGSLDAGEAPTFAAALSLANWHRRHGRCSSCGGPTDPNRGGWSRMCGSCGSEHYPRVDPVVIMLAEHDGRLLLGRQPQYPPGRYSALAGFVEPGESIEAAVALGIGGGSGISVRDVRYLTSQPWPFPNSLMIGAWAEASEDLLRIDRTAR